MQLLWKTWLHSVQALEFMVSLCCWGVSFLQRTHCGAGSGFLSRWMNACGRWLDVSMTRSTRPVRGCPYSCAGLSVTFWH